MEACFHNDPRVQEWISKIVEKIFTVCLLTGIDSEAEFQKGCQIIIKLTSLLQSELLEDGVKQLLDQRLPDARVIDSFPAFQATMDSMLREGLLQMSESQKKDILKGLASNAEFTKAISVEPHNSYLEKPNKVSRLEFDTYSSINGPYPDIQQTKDAALALTDALVQADAQAKVDAQTLAEFVAQVEVLTQAEKQAKADAFTFAEALTQAETQAKSDALTFADALAVAETQAKSDAIELAGALEQANTQANADALLLTETLGKADAQKEADALLLNDALAKVEALTQAEKLTKADALKFSEALAQAQSQAKTDALMLADTLAKADAQVAADALLLDDALAKFETLTQAEKLAKADALRFAEALAQANAKFDALKPHEPISLIKASSLLTSVHSKLSKVFRPMQDLKQVNPLKQVLTNIFPKSTVNWNKHLMGQTFLAQVEDILIYLHDPDHPCNLKKYHKGGWKVLVCSTEDLTFPRRLERGIRHLQRSAPKTESKFINTCV